MSYVLIVDDDPGMAQALADMVGLYDWTTRIVTSPRAALEMIQREPPVLMLLDLNMPGVNGMEVCRYIKRDPIAGTTPVVFVSAEDDPDTRERAREAGAMDYLVKPVELDRLEELLDKLPQRPGQASPPIQAEQKAPPLTSVGPRPPRDNSG